MTPERRQLFEHDIANLRKAASEELAKSDHFKEEAAYFNAMADDLKAEMQKEEKGEA